MIQIRAIKGLDFYLLTCDIKDGKFVKFEVTALASTEGKTDVEILKV
jgi:hypothetical protein